MTRAARITAAIFASGSAAILFAALGVTHAIVTGAPAWLRLLFRPMCHGMPSRCFHMNGVPFPLCARCTGIYVGFLIGIGLFVTIRSLQRVRIPGWMAFFLVAPLLIDGVTQGFGFRESTNELRVWTGLIAGTATLAWVMNRINRSPFSVVRSPDTPENGERTTENAGALS